MKKGQPALSCLPNRDTNHLGPEASPKLSPGVKSLSPSNSVLSCDLCFMVGFQTLANGYEMLSLPLMSADNSETSQKMKLLFLVKKEAKPLASDGRLGRLGSR